MRWPLIITYQLWRVSAQSITPSRLNPVLDFFGMETNASINHDGRDLAATRKNQNAVGRDSEKFGDFVVSQNFNHSSEYKLRV